VLDCDHTLVVISNDIASRSTTRQTRVSAQRSKQSGDKGMNRGLATMLRSPPLSLLSARSIYRVRYSQ
jgi:hypothetical protein